MIIQGLSKLTLLDYPEHIACTVFTPGCDFLCPFCHNASLVTHISPAPAYNEDEFFEFLRKRRHTLEGVCVTGGEPTLQPDLAGFLHNIKSLGFLVKLDTNGNHPEAVKHLLSENLIDYIAMDIKNSQPLYKITTGKENLNLENIINSVALIKSSSIPYEFRTTVVKELHTKESLLEIAHWLDGASNYYLQAFKDSGDLIDNQFSGYDKESLHSFVSMLTPYFGHVGLRGID